MNNLKDKVFKDHIGTVPLDRTNPQLREHLPGKAVKLIEALLLP